MSNQAYERIRNNLNQVEMRILRACAQANRDRHDITLVAVTKTRSLGEILAAHGCGLRHFGENRVEEMEAKLPHLKQALAQDLPLWHMIGHIQSRKASRVVETADVVHSLDSLKLAKHLDRFAAEAGRILPVLIEVNVSGEAAKYGLNASTPDETARFIEQAREMENLRNLDIQGLMTMAPLVDDPEESRPTFRQLARLRDQLREELPDSQWEELSMGMTNDFEVAIQEGASMVRIGRAIFGPRQE